MTGTVISSAVPSAGVPASGVRPDTSASRWRPTPGEPWQWQLSGPLDLTVDVPTYDLDWQETSAATVAALHDRGRHVICYLSVGTWENYRPDSRDYSQDVLGATLDDWPDERWVDIRRLDVLGPLLLRRLDTCRAKGFDAVEPDNVDAYSNRSGFPLTAADQLAFNRWIADAVHARGMSVALKNDLDQAGQLEPDFDFAINEECLHYSECDKLRPFVAAGKAVLHVEYDLPPDAFDRTVAPTGFSSMLKHRSLDAYRHVRPPDASPAPAS